uniref:Formyl transferase domain-containing protein,putative n=1 Tax=Neospora caninum (strain Liverpool) TaxID=572307 RepID=A0A0F7UM54_NEOCL|nr:TPA: formyl transferase domain-containing protein,putative [Neospora caninum Liverpool]
MLSAACTLGKCPQVSLAHRGRTNHASASLFSVLRLSLSLGLRHLFSLPRGFFCLWKRLCFWIFLLSFLWKKHPFVAPWRSLGSRERCSPHCPWRGLRTCVVSCLLLSWTSLCLSSQAPPLTSPVRQTATSRPSTSCAFVSSAAPASLSASRSEPLERLTLNRPSASLPSPSQFGVCSRSTPSNARLNSNVSVPVSQFFGFPSKQTAVDSTLVHLPRVFPISGRPLRLRLTTFVVSGRSPCSWKPRVSAHVTNFSSRVFTSSLPSPLCLWRPESQRRPLPAPQPSLAHASSPSIFPLLRSSFAAVSSASVSSSVFPGISRTFPPSTLPPLPSGSVASLLSPGSSLSSPPSPSFSPALSPSWAAVSNDAGPIRVLFIGSPAVAVSALEVLLASSLNFSCASLPSLPSDDAKERGPPASTKPRARSAAHRVGSVAKPNREKNILGLPGGFVVSAVLCRRPSRRGRGRKTFVPCPVQAFAETLSPPLPLFLASDLSSPSLLAALDSLSLDLAVCAAFALKLPDTLRSLPRHGTVLIHPSLLPRYRGAAPVRRALLNGERRVGVSLVRPSARFDEGALLHQSCLELSGNEHAEEVEEKLFQRGAQALLNTSLWTGRRTGGGPGVQQDASKATAARKIRAEERRISFAEMSASKIHNTVRALASHGSGVWTDLETGFFDSSCKGDQTEERNSEPGETVKEGAGCVANSRRGTDTIRQTMKVKLLRTRLGSVLPEEKAGADEPKGAASEEAPTCLAAQKSSSVVHACLSETPEENVSTSVASEPNLRGKKGSNTRVSSSQTPPEFSPQGSALSRNVCLDASGALRFVCGDGSVLLVEKLQRESRGPLSAPDFWNGLMGFAQRSRKSVEKSDASECMFTGEEWESERRGQVRSLRQRRGQAIFLRWVN